jgi:hypothetical protein
LSVTLGRYLVKGQCDDALHIYLDIGRGDPFSLISKHGLYGQAVKDAVLLFDFNAQGAVDLLLADMDEIPV